MELMVCVDGVEVASVPYLVNGVLGIDALVRAQEEKQSNPDALVAIVLVTGSASRKDSQAEHALGVMQVGLGH